MNNKIWAKTLLYAYNCLEKIVIEIDKNVLNCAVSTSKILGEEGTIRAFNQINKLTDRKLLLINLKIWVDSALNKMSEQNKLILRYKFLNCYNSDISSKMMGISQRTYFRKFKDAMAEFSYYLKIENSLHLNFADIGKRENWLLEIYNKLLDKEIHQTFKKYSNEFTDTQISQAVNTFDDLKFRTFAV